MNREVFVECGPEEHGFWIGSVHLKKIEIHESRWIPVSEKPEREGRYPIVLENQDKFDGYSGYWDGDSWTHPVKLWLEAPPLPVEDEFEKWWESKNWNPSVLDEVKQLCRIAWNAAKESK